MDQPPLVFAGHRIRVAAAQEADVVGVLEVGDGPRIAVEPPVEEPDGPLVLLAVGDQDGLLGALGLKSDAWQLQIEHDADDRRGGHDEQQRESGLLPCPPASHPACSSSGKVCSCWNCTSSTTTELIPTRTTLYRFLTSWPSVATTISSPSRKKTRLAPEGAGAAYP